MFASYKKREDIESGIVVELEHGGKARLRDYGGIAFTEALLNLYIDAGLAGTLAEDVPQATRNKLEHEAVIRGCVVSLFDPDEERWIDDEDDVRAVLLDPQYSELYREIKMHTMERNHFLADDSKKKTRSSSKASPRTSKRLNDGETNIPVKASTGPTSTPTESGRESRAS